jgi:hypothetical protein
MLNAAYRVDQGAVLDRTWETEVASIIFPFQVAVWSQVFLGVVAGEAVFNEGRYPDRVTHCTGRSELRSEYM